MPFKIPDFVPPPGSAVIKREIEKRRPKPEIQIPLYDELPIPEYPPQKPPGNGGFHDPSKDIRYNHSGNRSLNYYC